MKECEQRGISVGFIDPYIVNERILHQFTDDMEHDLCREFPVGEIPVIGDI